MEQWFTLVRERALNGCKAENTLGITIDPESFFRLKDIAWVDIYVFYLYKVINNSCVWSYAQDNLVLASEEDKDIILNLALLEYETIPGSLDVMQSLRLLGEKCCKKQQEDAFLKLITCMINAAIECSKTRDELFASVAMIWDDLYMPPFLSHLVYYWPSKKDAQELGEENLYNNIIAFNRVQLSEWMQL